MLQPRVRRNKKLNRKFVFVTDLYPTLRLYKTNTVAKFLESEEELSERILEVCY
jgi:hypothetical protein